jgi:hypothetical protein
LPYDLLLQGGHVIDAKNAIDGVTDVAIKDGKVAAVGQHLHPADAVKTIDLAGYYVTPPLAKRSPTPETSASGPTALPFATGSPPSATPAAQGGATSRTSSSTSSTASRPACWPF